MAVQPVATLVGMAGDHASAVVLSQIMFWHQGGKLKVERKGTLWLAKSRAELCAETQITLDQYKRIMPSLVKRGLIVMERGLFKNKVTPHIQLTPNGVRAMTLLFKPTSKLGVKGTSRLVASTHNPRLVAYDTNDLVQESTQESTTESTPDLATGVAGGGETDLKSDTEAEGGEDQNQHQALNQAAKIGESSMKAEDILKAHRGSLTGSLSAFWKAQVKEVFGGGYQKDLTGKEKGQLKLLSKYLGTQTKPVIAYAVSNWSKFAAEAGISAGVQTPNEPHIGFLLKYHAVAVNLLTPVKAPIVPKVHESPTAWVPANAETEPAFALSPQELTELLASFDLPLKE